MAAAAGAGVPVNNYAAINQEARLYLAATLAIGAAGAVLGLISDSMLFKVAGIAIANLGAWGFIATLACAAYAYYKDDQNTFTNNIQPFLAVVGGLATAAMLKSNWLYFAIMWG